MKARKKQPEIESACPIPDTHRRLSAAHRLWHQTSKVYSNPEAFRTNLNATIQELRNVTFIVQKEQRKIPDFEPWYAAHQQRLRQDPICRWIVDARNQIVKQGDLDTRSTARVVLVADYEDLPPWSGEVPPTSSSKQIAAWFAQQMPTWVRDAYLEVERRWEVDDLPGYELLEALAHSYDALEGLVRDAHAACQTAYSASPCPAPPRAHEDPAVGCMEVEKRLRTARIHLPGMRFGTIRKHTIRASKSDAKVGEKHYGDLMDFESIRAGFGSDDYRVRARTLHGMARAIIQRDPSLGTAVFLYKNRVPVHHSILMAQDKADKFALWRNVADIAESLDADAIAVNAESWIHDMNGEGGTKEAVITFYEQSDGAGIVLTSLFTREGDSAVLGEAEEEPNAESIRVIEPLRQVWKAAGPITG